MYPMNNQPNIWGTTPTGGEMAKQQMAPLRGVQDPQATPMKGGSQLGGQLGKIGGAAIGEMIMPGIGGQIGGALGGSLGGK